MKSRPLFFLFDPFSISKCIRNNWLGQKDAKKYMLFTKFSHKRNHELDSIQSAPFCTVQKLNALESQLILKCYKLTSKALSSINIERQNVNSTLQIFNEYTFLGSLTLGKQKYLPNLAEVHEYVNIFYIWWTILNVKTLYKGCWLRNKYSNCNILTNKREITSDATGVTAHTTSGEFGQ